MNGDPFDYVNSTIPYINSAQEFQDILLKHYDIYVIIVSYQNNYFGKNIESFTLMARRYDSMHRQLANNKNIKMYRAHMTQNLHPSLYGYRNPSCQIYYQGQRLDTLEGTVSAKEISAFLQKNIFRSIPINEGELYIEN